MRPGIYDLALYRGDTYAWKFTLWKDFVGGAPADLTGVIAKAEIRDKPGGVLVVAMVCTVTQPNIVDVKLSAGAWTSFTATTAAWDLQLTYPQGDVVTIVAGAVKVTLDVTDTVPVSTQLSPREVRRAVPV